MLKWLKRVGVVLFIALLAAQLVPVMRNNPIERNYLEAPEGVQGLLRRSCNDCHSHETQWPWYARLAPASFLIARDVKEGRKKLNFSIWDSYDENRRARKKKEIAKEVGNATMPPWYYVPLHPQTKLSAEEQEQIVRWANQR